MNNSFSDNITRNLERIPTFFDNLYIYNRCSWNDIVSSRMTPRNLTEEQTARFTPFIAILMSLIL